MSAPESGSAAGQSGWGFILLSAAALLAVILRGNGWNQRFHVRNPLAPRHPPP